ncbi:autotransporter outer membrane beta-barrel domain-containing protein [Reyranella aquatilis]|uniref:Autotransporter outer membrane beta-barrel domain-containing protein n=1 Tax=Reyranella aquatilis TaxID=2035356 RepID=A0ABS8KXJ8_9HYPH|nr:autotransporter outer membrane beta-barrel domain-containing protein [Reyranella aquatilis]MCC8430822.1 autotransporter outer membrane beta-barrel domain-containing protein [Reyranella aquatilis]
MKRGRKRLPSLAVAAIVSAAGTASAQDSRWDGILSNSNWYVAIPNLVAYAGANRSQTSNPFAIGDQTLWALGTATNGRFTGQSEATFAIGPTVTAPSNSSMNGVVTETGQIRIEFTSADSPTIIGIGQMREIGGVPFMEMQMITGTSLLVTHWAYMAPYNPAVFTPPSPTQYVSADITSPEWRWTAGTTWQLRSPDVFGTATPGTFKINGYSNGYYWGVGAAPLDSLVGNFTVLGSMTPEGNVLFSLLFGPTYGSLSGQITGDATTGSMVLRSYTLSGATGLPTTASIMPVSPIAAGQTYFLSNVGSTVIPAFTGGTLQVDTSGSTFNQNFVVDGSATNRLDLRGNSAVLSGVLSDAIPGTPGRLTIANSGLGGSVSFAGNSTYTGLTTIDAGATLSVDGSIVSPVSVNGTLRGTGTVGGATTVQSGGTLAPGNSPGTLTFAAPVVMAPGSTLSLDIDGTGTGAGAGNYSRVVVTGAGNGFTAGGTLQPVLRGITGAATNAFTPSIGQQFVVVSAEGGVQGSFAGLAQPTGLAAGTRFDALYGPSSVSLVVTPASYGNLGAAGLPQTPNQVSVGQALDVLRPAVGLRMSGLSQSLFAPLYSLPAASIPQALDQLSPSLYGDMMLSARQGFYGFSDQVSQRLGTRRAAQGEAQGVAAACGDACAGLPNAAPRSVAGPLGTTAWLSGFGQWTQVAAAAAPGFQSSLAGVMAGLDVELGPGFVAGVALGGGSANTFAGNGAAALGSAFQAMLYGEYAMGSLFFGGQVAYLNFDQTTTRSLGAWNSVSRDSVVTNGVGGQVAAGLRLGFDGWSVEPTLALAVLGLSSPATVEQNPNGLAQQVNGQSLTSVRGAVTLPVSRTLALADQRALTVRGLLGCAHEFADVSATTQAAFAAAPGVAFATTTAPIARDSALVGLSADFAVDDGVAFFAGWQGSIGSSSTSQTFRAGLRMTW